MKQETKNYELTESGKAEVLSESCPICGAGADNNTQNWDFSSNRWEKIPLLCEHGFRFNENLNGTDDAANDDWQTSVLILPQYIPELEALGYTEIDSSPEIPAKPAPIYVLPCSRTGLDANIDNCDPPAIIVEVEADDPMSAGCVDRYRTTDGYLVDINIDSSDFSDWFEEELKKEVFGR